jgi:hypothetical protein
MNALNQYVLLYINEMGGSFPTIYFDSFENQF